MELLEKKMQQRLNEAYVAAGAAPSDWYDTAHDLAHAMASRTGTPFRQTVAAIAMLSQQSSWATNIDAAQKLLAAPVFETRIKAFHSTKRRVLQVLQGGRLSKLMGGRKIRNFYLAILRPDNVRTFVIDRHMARVLMGEHLDERGIGAFLRSRPRYAMGVRAGIAAAVVNGVTPNQLQAAIWEHIVG